MKMQSPSRTLAASRLALFLPIVAPACSAPTTASDWSAGSTVSAASPFRGSAFVIDLDTRQLKTKISAPTGGISRNVLAHQISTPGVSSPHDGAAHLSVLGSDAVEVGVANLVRGRVGASVPGKVLLTFDLRLISKLHGVRLITPTFPIAPAGVSGVQAFPFEVSVITSAGSVGAIGNELAISSPQFGAVMASDDWDGPPHSFFAATPCTGASNDCFRYEPFGTVAPMSASASRRVGFLIDPTVGDIRIRLLVAADIRIE